MELRALRIAIDRQFCVRALRIAIDRQFWGLDRLKTAQNGRFGPTKFSQSLSGKD
jgi:hypothetical protein